MSSDRKSEAARINGAKSHGPVTPEGQRPRPEGRARSSQNSIRHGLAAKSVVLPSESREQFQLLLDSHIDEFEPQSEVEMEMVEALAVARWRLRRVWTLETNLFTNENTVRKEYIDYEFKRD